jgi:integrase
VFDTTRQTHASRREILAQRIGQLLHQIRGYEAQVLKHFAAVPVHDVGAVYDRLCVSKAMSALALRFIILAAARAREVAGLEWPELDLGARVWTLPPQRSKTGRAHRVPLSDEAMNMVEDLRKASSGCRTRAGRTPSRAVYVPFDVSSAARKRGGGARRRMSLH